VVSLPRWKQVLCSFAGVLLLVGIGMKSVLLVRDGLLSPQSGTPTRMLNPSPEVKWPGPPPAVTNIPGAPDETPLSKVNTSPPGAGGKEPDEETRPQEPVESPGAEDQQPRSALVEPAAAAKSDPGIDQNVAPGSTASGSSPGSQSALDEDLLKEWSPAFLKGGLGFFVAFLVGFALQAFARLFALFLGLFCLGVMSLSSLGWVTIEWTVAQQQFQDLPSVLSNQFSGFQSFLQGALPSIGMAGLGLFAGLKKK